MVSRVRADAIPRVLAFIVSGEKDNSKIKEKNIFSCPLVGGMTGKIIPSNNCSGLGKESSRYYKPACNRSVKKKLPCN